VADAFDFEQSPVDLAADFRQIRQVGQSLVDAKILRVAERAFGSAAVASGATAPQVIVMSNGRRVVSRAQTGESR
jgi:hypothetical protein